MDEYVCLRCGPVDVSDDPKDRCVTDVGWAVVWWGRHVRHSTSEKARPGDLEFFFGTAKAEEATDGPELPAEPESQAA